MTRKEAIERIKNDIEFNHNRLANEYITALEMAIEALEHDKKEIINMKSVFNLSDDLISRQAAIEAVHSYFKDKLNGWPREETEEGYEVYCDMDKIDAFLSDNKYLTKRIEAIPSADRPEWIPVTERLPEEGLTVLILAESGNIEFGQRDENKWEWLAESIADYWTEAEEVIAWQPLPEPYTNSN